VLLVLPTYAAPLTQTATTPLACFPFTRDLTIRSQGEDVRALQEFLNAHGAPLASTGTGSPGSETTYFGPLTKAALAKYQATHAISPPAGYFGPITRAALCLSAQPPPASAAPPVSLAPTPPIPSGFIAARSSHSAPDKTPPTFSGTPSNITAEATTDSGAAVSYMTPIATDKVDRTDAVSCAPSSGSIFALGTTTVTCITADNAGNSSDSSFTVTVQDTTAPTISGTPSNITAEASSDGGSAVSYTNPTASDLVDGTVAVSCLPASGSTFALGITLIRCTASDSRANTASSTFQIIVGDTTGPVLTLPSDMTAEATSGSGATVSYAPSAADTVDGNVPVNCTPASATVFAIGAAVVHCSATDASANTTAGSFIVTVRDTTAPSISLSAPANGATVSGASVVLTGTASDAVGVASVQFKVDGGNLGSAITNSPYTANWNSTSAGDGVHTLYAVAKDTSGNYATSSISITVDNTPPVISSISSGTPGTSTTTITWTTNEAASSQISYGTTASYGTASSSATLATSQSITLTGLTASTAYHFQIQSADAQGNSATSSDQTFTTASAYSAQAQSFFARLATQPTAARKAIYDTMITGLVYAGVWPKLDGLYILAAADAATARTNLIQSSFGASVVGSPAFAADAGYTGDNTVASYLETSFDPTVGTPNFSLNSSSIFVWKNTDSGTDIGGMAGRNASTYLYVTDGGSPNFAARSTGGNELAYHNAIASNTGLFEATRTGSALSQSYVSAVPIISETTASYLTGVGTMKFLTSGLGDGSNSQLAASGVGGALTGADSRNLNTCINQYLTGVGASSASSSLLGFSSDIITNGANNWAPGMRRLADGRLLVVYGVGTGSQQNSKLVYHLSTDNGKTWSVQADLLLPPSAHLLDDPSVTVLSNGIILVSFMNQANDSSTLATEVIRGTVAGDLSISWSSPIVVSSTYGSSSYVLPLANNTLMLGLYDAAVNEADVIFSSDGGLTWGGQTVVAAAAGYDEANYAQLANGTIVGILRKDGAGYWLVSSTDNGATWTSPVQKFNGTVAGNPGRPALLITPSGTLFLVGRFTESGSASNTGYSYSTDGGATWAAPANFYSFTNKNLGSYGYAQGFYDAATQSLMYAIGQGAETGTAQMIFQQFSLP
jgi:hypothetical protein